MGRAGRTVGEQRGRGGEGALKGPGEAGRVVPTGSLWRPTQPQADAAWPWWVAGLPSERGSSWPRVTPAGRALLAEGGPGCPGGTASWVAKEVLWISLKSWSRRCGSEPLQSCTQCARSAAFLPWALRVCGQLPVSASGHGCEAGILGFRGEKSRSRTLGCGGSWGIPVGAVPSSPPPGGAVLLRQRACAGRLAPGARSIFGTGSE